MKQNRLSPQDKIHIQKEANKLGINCKNVLRMTNNQIDKLIGSICLAKARKHKGE
jgi:hypothetical protein